MKESAQNILEFILNNDIEGINTLLQNTKSQGGKFIEDDESSLALAICQLINNTSDQLDHRRAFIDLGLKLIDLVDHKSFENSDNELWSIMWGVVNPRGADGEQDPTYLALTAMIKNGWNIAATSFDGRDLFHEVSSQRGHPETDLALTILLLKTEKVLGFEGEKAKQALEDLNHEEHSIEALKNLNTLARNHANISKISGRYSIENRSAEYLDLKENKKQNTLSFESEENSISLTRNGSYTATLEFEEDIKSDTKTKPQISSSRSILSTTRANATRLDQHNKCCTIS